MMKSTRMVLLDLSALLAAVGVIVATDYWGVATGWQLPSPSCSGSAWQFMASP